MLQMLSWRGRQAGPAPQLTGPFGAKQIGECLSALLAARSDVAAVRNAKTLLAWIDTADRSSLHAFFRILVEEYDPDPAKVEVTPVGSTRRITALAASAT
jgi:hypothetical protein